MLKMQLTLLAFLLLTPCGTSAQEQQQPTTQAATPVCCRLCPTINVTCPGSVLTGSTVNFSAQIVGAGPDPHLTFAWSVSGGTIIDGQGTSAINVDTTGLNGQPLTTTIAVGGLDNSCSKTASCSTTIAPLMIYDHLDDFGAISRRDEHARLDNFAAELQSAPEAIGYIIVYGGRREYAGEVQRRVARIKQYLIKRRQIAAMRIVIVDGGYREEATTDLWPVPPGLPPPTASPTVSPDEVQIIRPNKHRRRPK